MASPALVHQLATLRQMVRPETSVQAFLKGPQQLLFARHVPSHLATAVTKASKLWKDGTLVVDGALTHDRKALADAVGDLLQRLQNLKDGEDKYLYDTLHVLSKMLRVLRFVLLHPSRPPGTLTLRFPRSETGLERLAAAERFFHRRETKEDSALLKRIFGNPKGLADVARKATVYAFQSPEALHLLTPYRVETFSKSDLKVADLRTMVAAA